eukprot:scaffold8248_cov45-Phaeocystis_antarctica.AAC.1
MELGKNGHFFPKTAPLTPVSIDTASTPPRHRLDTSDTSDTQTLQGSISIVCTLTEMAGTR